MPIEEAKKVSDFFQDEDFQDALEAHVALKEFQTSGEKGIPVEVVFKELE